MIQLWPLRVLKVHTMSFRGNAELPEAVPPRLALQSAEWRRCSPDLF